MGPAGSDFRSFSEHKYYAKNSRLFNCYTLPQTTTSAEPTDSKLYDVFGSVPQDIQVEILGYIAVHSPAQIVSMRRVCKRWNDILNQDSIYHSAIFTTSFSPPLDISRKSFEKTAFTNSRLRNTIFSKAKGLDCVVTPRTLIYRDGFLVWWTFPNFEYINFNKTKPASRRHILGTAPLKFIRTPIYALGGGVLIYAMHSEEVASQSAGLRLQAVRLGEPLQKGSLDLSNLWNAVGMLELYCSSEYAMALKGLEILVLDLSNIATMKVIRTLPLQEHTNLVLPIVNDIKISNNGRCLVVLSSDNNVEALAFSLKTGSLLKRYSTKTPLENRDKSTAIYHIQNSQDFPKDTQYQTRNATHRELKPPTVLAPGRNEPYKHYWLQIPPIKGNEDECITGAFISSSTLLPQHQVIFPRQHLRFSAFEDNDYSMKTVQWHSLRIERGHLGRERRDIDPDDPDDPDETTSVSQTNIDPQAITWCTWCPPAKISPPSDCVIRDSDGNTVTHTDRWLRNRQLWSSTGTLLGDEKALILVLPYHLVIWKFQTFQTWQDRGKNRIKNNINNVISFGLFIVVAAVSMPTIIACSPCLLTRWFLNKPKNDDETLVATVHPWCHDRPTPSKNPH